MLDRRDMLKMLGSLILLPTLPDIQITPTIPAPLNEWSDYMLIKVSSGKTKTLAASRYMFFLDEKKFSPVNKNWVMLEQKSGFTDWAYHLKPKDPIDDSIFIEFIAKNEAFVTYEFDNVDLRKFEEANPNSPPQETDENKWIAWVK